MDITIREYQETDRGQIIKWIEDRHDYLVNLDPHKRLCRQPEYGQVFFTELFDFVNNRQGKIFVAIEGEKLVGFSGGGVDRPSPKDLLEVVPGKLGVISEIFVEQSYRGKGIGTMLLQKLETYLKSLGCDSLWLNVLSFNPAHDLYRKLGYYDREIGMLKKL